MDSGVGSPLQGHRDLSHPVLVTFRLFIIGLYAGWFLWFLFSLVAEPPSPVEGWLRVSPGFWMPAPVWEGHSLAKGWRYWLTHWGKKAGDPFGDLVRQS